MWLLTAVILFILIARSIARQPHRRLLSLCRQYGISDEHFYSLPDIPARIATVRAELDQAHSQLLQKVRSLMSELAPGRVDLSIVYGMLSIGSPGSWTCTAIKIILDQLMIVPMKDVDPWATAELIDKCEVLVKKLRYDFAQLEDIQSKLLPRAT